MSMKRMAGVVAATVMIGGAQAAFAPSAHAAGCAIGGSGISYNRDGDAAKFSGLAPQGKMNCPSARYVLNKWLRPSFERTYANRLPTNFFDGYVTWHCSHRTSTRWQCREYDSNTTFRFTAYLL